MTGSMITVMMVLFVLSVPVAIAIGIAAIVGIYGFTTLPMIVAPQQMFIALDRFPLAAIPFFILAGNLMTAGGLSRRLVEVARSFVGGIQGGLALTCILTCMMFSTISGSSVATTFAVGSVIIPVMVRFGYPVGFAAALTATAAELGVILPPSIPMILYGVATQTSIPNLFMAGIGPGILVAASLMVTVVVWCRMRGWGTRDGENKLRKRTAIRKAFFALLMPPIIVGGIYGGITTPTEASVIAVVYALVVGVFIHRELSMRELAVVFRNSVISASVIMFVIATASFFAYLLNRQGVPDMAATWLVDTFQESTALMLAMNVMLFVVGMFVETGATIIVLAPILQAAAVQVGIDPVHFGMVMVFNLALGMIVPPFAVNLFAACQVAQCSLFDMMRPLWVFIGVMVFCLMVVAFVPQVSLALPAMFGR